MYLPGSIKCSPSAEPSLVLDKGAPGVQGWMRSPPPPIFQAISKLAVMSESVWPCIRFTTPPPSPPPPKKRPLPEFGHFEVGWCVSRLAILVSPVCVWARPSRAEGKPSFCLESFGTVPTNFYLAFGCQALEMKAVAFRRTSASPPPPPSPPPPVVHRRTRPNSRHIFCLAKYISILLLCTTAEQGVHGPLVPVRGGVALRADSGALEAVGVAADAGLPPAAAHARLGAGGAVPLHLRRAALFLAHASPHGADGVGVHDGASAPAPINVPINIKLFFFSVFFPVFFFFKLAPLSLLARPLCRASLAFVGG